MPDYGQQISTGIKYIKVSKTDKEGNNNSQNLQTANKLRINYPDVGVQEYLIQTSQNFADYYLFGVIPNANTSSINEILDYSVEASYTGFVPFSTPTTPTNLKDTSFGIASVAVVTGNSLGYYTSSGADNTTITFGNTPNIDINFSFSGSLLNNTGFDQTITLALINIKSSEGVDDSPIAENTITVPANASPQDFEIPLTLSSSYGIVEGQSYSFQMRGSDLSVTILASSPLLLLFTGSIPPVTTTETLVTIEPSYDFQFSDYNVLNGNIDIARTSRQFLYVDYSTGVLTPTTITTIISGTATPAAVQDSNYTLQRHTNPRYGGSRQSSPDFNTVVRTSSTNNPTQPIRTIYQAPENDGSAGK